MTLLSLKLEKKVQALIHCHCTGLIKISTEHLCRGLDYLWALDACIELARGKESITIL